MKHDQRFVWLDLVRGASAIAVCVGHLRAATLCDYGELQAPHLFQKVFYLLTGLGHQAVMVFFVLSGFFVGGSILKSGDRFDLMKYSIARLTRLWIVLIPTLAVTFVVDQVIAAHAPEVLRGAYYAIWNSGPLSASSYSTSIPTLLGNLLFLQTVLTPVFGTNTPLWSLANEFCYYATFPLFAFAFGKIGGFRRLWVRGAIGVAAGFLVLSMPAGIRSGYLIWCMGVIVYLASIRLPCRRRPAALIFTFGIFAVSIAYSKVIAWQSALTLRGDFAVGLGFSMLCVVLASWPAPRVSSVGVAASRFAGAVSDFSYSLYLSHFPFVVLIAALMYQSTQVAPDLVGLVNFFCWFGVLLSLGALSWFLFERHTNIIRGLFTRALTKQA